MLNYDFFLLLFYKLKTKDVQVMSQYNNGQISQEDGRKLCRQELAEYGIPTLEEALAGASDIIAEIISDEAKYRKWIRSYFERKALLASELKDINADEKHTYEMYYKYEEPISEIKAHRILALNRGESEKVLKVLKKIKLARCKTLK